MREKMEEYLRTHFDVEPKRPSEEALKRWRSAVSIVKNPTRRFRMVADLAKRAEDERKRKNLQEKIRVALYVQKAALQFIDAGNRGGYNLSKEVKDAGFGIDPEEIASFARSHDTKGLEGHGGVSGLAGEVSVSLKDGVVSSKIPIRQNIFGLNQYAEKPSKGFLMFLWEALQDLTLIILMVAAAVSIGVGIATEGMPKGMYDGLGIIVSILLVVLVTAISDYKQSLQFKELDKEKKNIMVQVTRDGRRQKVSIYDLVVGEIVHLSIGDQVPADGIFISGHSLQVDESSLSGESEPVDINQDRPFLLAGTKVQDGSGKMLVTSVGMRTEWGRLMVTLSEGGDNETPLQVKLNGVATIIGKIGLAFAVLTFIVLISRFLVNKAVHHHMKDWSSKDAQKLLNYFSTAVIIIVVAVPEGLPLAVTLSLAFAMKKLMSDKALVRHLSACETMGSATCICTDKTGTLTTNHMVVNKIWVCNETKTITSNENNDELKSASEGVHNLLLQSIFLNTSAEVVKGEDGKNSIIGTPTETAIIEFGMLLGGDFKSYSEDYKILTVEPFNSVRKKMSVLAALPDGGKKRAFCKGASEIILEMCDNVVGTDGEAVPLSDEQRTNISDIINGFACEALRTLCLAFKNIDDSSKGPDFRNKSSQEMAEIIPKLQVMARSLPLDKHTLVKQLRNELREVVAVTGDGTNDAPALHEADIGLAMGIAGTEVAKENADVIIMDDNFTSIVNVARWGRAVYINIQKFVQFQLTVNIAALMLNFVSACVSGSAPLTAVQMLWVNLIMDTLGALALATEPPNEGLMKRPPVGRNVKFITGIMWRNIVGQSIYQIAVLLVLKFCGIRLLKLTGSDANSVLNTVIFNSFVFCQAFNEINSRDMEKINVFSGIFSSYTFMMVMISTVVFQIIIVEFLGKFAQTVPLSWELWLTSVLIGAVSLLVAVVLKFIPVSVRKQQAPRDHEDVYKPLLSGPDNA
ncbi:probable calcium-transporting ATPase 9, plasma membrane-type isoform X2 [Pyrus x bretschneideri]|uniref:probable calcium-transporting ATPase 9, plasma membrane-type isoform X2 n=1 Tax=Pyrus x bretschneideri TaxID=225117 RepID=UPI0020302221|nr:probable calcium-transporting ATPase 9, plasma membrane-type isoform X2 [Pyrus x bretschneideri]